MDEHDPRFVREGRELREWLWDLMSADRLTRRRAENAISAMWFGAPVADATVYLHAPKDMEGHRRAWEEAVRRILNDPSFEGAAFLREAYLRAKADAQSAAEHYEIQKQFWDKDDLEPTEQAALTERLRQSSAAREADSLPNSLGKYTLILVLEQAGAVLVRMPDLVRENLRDRTTGNATAKALRLVGPPAVEFAPELLRMIDALTTDEGIFHDEATLAAIGRGDGPTIHALLERAVRSGNERVAYAAISTLGEMGPEVLVLEPSLVDELLVLDNNREKRVAMLSTVARLAPEREDVFERVLALARPAPPRMRAVEGFPQYQYDEVMGGRGVAIEALGHFRLFADRAVPVLADAIETFDEFDPDWSYERAEHGRVIASLRALGPENVVAAVPVLKRHVRQSDGDLDLEVIRLLGEIGLSAREALAALKELEEQTKGEPEEEPLDRRDWPPDPTMDVLGWSIWRIEGGEGGGGERR